MAEFKLRLPGFWDFQRRHASTVHVVGLDGIPWPCRVSLEEGCLVIRRNRDESGRIYVSFPFTRRGEITVCTGTLPEREKPYDFVTELARGTLNRLRNQTSIWQEGGLEIPEQVQRLTGEATGLLGRSLLSNEKNRSEDEAIADKDISAKQSIETAMDAMFLLCDHFGKTISDYRVSQEDLPPFWLATTISNAEQLQNNDTKCFDLWHTDLELTFGASQNGQRLVLGPLLDASPGAIQGFDANSFPDFDTRKRSIREACHHRLAEISDRTSLIHAVSGLNGIGHRHLSFSQQMQLTAEVLAAIDESPADVPVLVSFDHPWAERLASSVGGIHPLQIADSLLRHGGPISFLGLEVNLDYWPSGSVTRDPLQWIDLIDVWLQLGLPLVLCMRVPQGINNGSCEQLVDGVGKKQGDSQAESVSTNNVRCNLSDTQRMELLDTILPMIIARPGVHGIIWRQWQDTDDVRFPGGGLTDASGESKGIVAQIRRIRSTVLKRT